MNTSSADFNHLAELLRQDAGRPLRAELEDMGDLIYDFFQQLPTSQNNPLK